MAFSLSNWFKGKSPAPGEDSEAESTAPEQAQTPVPPSVRTATPHTVAQQTPVSLREPTARPPVTLTATKLPTSAKVTPVLPTSRRVSFPTGSTAVATETPAAPSVTPSPAFTPTAPDVTISLEVGDFLDRLPATFLQSGSFDRKKMVEFQASELYSDLSKGRASVPASVIYHRCPEIFSRPVTATEDVEVQLPLQKLVEQMGTALSTRTDQLEEENVGEIETPFLQVALEDNARVPTASGSTTGAVRSAVPLTKPVPSEPEQSGPVLPSRPPRTGQISTISPVKAPVEAASSTLVPPTVATASPIIAGKRPPSTVRASVAGGKIRLSGPAAVTRITPANPEAPAGRPGTHSQRISLPIQPAAPASPSHQVTKKTARIQIPPISLRTGGPTATPRPGSVPPPPTAPAAPAATPEGIPNFRPSVGKEGAPTISFRTSPPPSAKPLPPSFAPPRPPAFPPPAFPVAATAAPAPVVAVPAVADDRKIELGLAAVLRSLPSSMLSVEPSAVPDDVRVSLPFALVEPQLSQGRVMISREVFIQALPESHRQVLSADADPAGIPLPLQEVFQNLPSSALRIRGDQVAEETGMHYPTPFSQKADEDAQRLASPSAVTAAPAVPAEPEAKVAATPEVEIAEPEVGTAEPAAEESKMTDAAPVEAAPVRVPSIDVELPVDSTTEPVRDTPLEPEAAPAALDAPAASNISAEEVTEVPVAVRDIPLGDDVHPEEGPVSNAPVAVPELKLSEPPPKTVEPAVPEVARQTLEAPVQDAPINPPEPITLPPIPAAVEKLAPAPVVTLEVQMPVMAENLPTPAPAKPVGRVLPASDGVLQTLFMTEEELDAKSIVKFVCQLPAVDGCAVMFEDGLRLAGNFPDGNTEGFSAMAAPFYKRAVRFVSELELGGLQAFTMHTEHGLLSFFMHDNICVSVHHTGRGFMPGVREKLEVVTHELALMYATTSPLQDVK